RGGEEMRTPREWAIRIGPYQPQAGLMNERRGLERLSRRLASEPAGRQLAQLFIDQREQPGRGIRLAPIGVDTAASLGRADPRRRRRPRINRRGSVTLRVPLDHRRAPDLQCKWTDADEALPVGATRGLMAALRLELLPQLPDLGLDVDLAVIRI